MASKKIDSIDQLRSVIKPLKDSQFELRFDAAKFVDPDNKINIDNDDVTHALINTAIENKININGVKLESDKLVFVAKGTTAELDNIVKLLDYMRASVENPPQILDVTVVPGKGGVAKLRKTKGI